MRKCLTCPTKIPTGSRCSVCRARKERERNAARAGRYGGAYQQARASWANYLMCGGTTPCGRCGITLSRADSWHLDHLPSGALQPSHALCNLRAVHTDGTA